ncbi:MAG: PDDEXK nuclease domain-containing protein [Prevotellaceae bacterium]|jgi:predicted nuclease of restriction endonuclease-like (RecB) superfamily|nr:PDDEXK nuclease domain-containing protein [Prevotellaceae bacterium]
MSDITPQINFDHLIDNVYQTHCLLQQNAQKAVNQNLTVRNWLIGCYIVEFEQNGEDRAKYGERLLEEIAKSVKVKGIKGLNSRALSNCRLFYTLYPQILRSVTAKLQTFDFQKIITLSAKELQIRRSVTAKLVQSLPQIRESVPPKLQKDKNQPVIIRGSLTRESKIQQTLSVESEEEEYLIPSDMLLSRISFTHFVEIIRKDDPLERLFYEVETIKNNWSVRELERAINSGLYLRTGLSKDKEAIIAKFKNQKPAAAVDVIRDPYFLEFLGLEERPQYSESELEQAILNHLQHFLIELGTGFCFEARQKRITFDNTHYRIDLVFYHRILKSHILIDLKIGKFDHADAGQMNVYLNYFRDNEMADGDNPPIGLILCGDKNETLARYATTGIDNQLFVSKFLVNLPEQKVLEDFIRREIMNN